MFAQDLLYGRLLLQCTCCTTLVVLGSYQAQYCSVTCRLRHQKRRLRVQMKNARTLRAQGQTLRQIAAWLDQRLEIARGWIRIGKGKRVSNFGRKTVGQSISRA